MKFAKELETRALAKWRDHYVRYKVLKKILHALRGLDSGADGASSEGGASAASGAAAAAVPPSRQRTLVEATILAARSILNLPGAVEPSAAASSAAAERSEAGLLEAHEGAGAGTTAAAAAAAAAATAGEPSFVDVTAVSPAAPGSAAAASPPAPRSPRAGRTPGGDLVAAAEARAARAEAHRALARDVSRRFFAELQADLDRANAFVAAARASVAAERQALAEQPEAADAGADARRERLAADRRLWAVVNDLHDFAELNYTAFYKICKKHDKAAGVRTVEAVMRCLDAQPFTAALNATGAAGRSAALAAADVPPQLLADAIGLAATAGAGAAAGAVAAAAPQSRSLSGRLPMSQLSFKTASVGESESDDEDASPAVGIGGVGVGGVRDLSRSRASIGVGAAAAGLELVSQSPAIFGIAEQPEAEAGPEGEDGSGTDGATGLPIDLGADEEDDEHRERDNLDTLTAEALGRLLREHIGGGLNADAGTGMVVGAGAGVGAESTGARSVAGADKSSGEASGAPSWSGRGSIVGDHAGRAPRPRTSILPRDRLFERPGPALPSGALTPQTPARRSGSAEAAPISAASALVAPATELAPLATPSALAATGSAVAALAAASTALPPRPPSPARSLVPNPVTSPALDWSSRDRAVLGSLLHEFDVALMQSYSLADSALRLASPEAPDAERLKRLARFTASLLRAQAHARRRAAGARTTMRQLHDCILALKCELLRGLLRLLVRQVHATSPEDAAALEHVSMAHYVLLGMYSSAGARAAPPSQRNIELLVAGLGARSEGAGVAPGGRDEDDNDEEDEEEGEEEDGDGGGVSDDDGEGGADEAAGRVAIDRHVSIAVRRVDNDRRSSTASTATGFPSPRAAIPTPRTAAMSLPLPLPLPIPATPQREVAQTSPLALPDAEWRVALLWLFGLDGDGGGYSGDGSGGSGSSGGAGSGGIAALAKDPDLGPARLAQLLWRRWRPPLFDWLPEYKWRKYLRRDVAAGITIGVVLVPQGLAYAALAGLPPAYGLFTAFPGVIYAVFGTSRHAAIGPMSIPALLIAAGVSGMANAPASAADYAAAVFSLTLMSGLLLLVMGWLHLGFVIRFLSRPVLMGFTSAAALLTISSTAKDLLGAPFPRSAVLQDFIVALPTYLPATHAPTALVSAAALAMLLALPQWPRARGVPASLVVVTLFTAGFAAIMAATGDDGGRSRGSGAPAATSSGIALVGAISGGFPSFAVPPLSLPLFYQLAPTAASVTFVGFIESVAVAKLYALKHEYDIATESELKALGLANVVGSLFQSFPVMGAFGRSAINDAAGANSQVSGFVAAATVALMIAVLTPALFYLAKPVLAALIVAAVVNLVDVAGLRRLLAADRRDFAICLSALACTLFLGVLPGVLAAMLLSLVLFLASTTQPRVEELGRREGTVLYEPVGGAAARAHPHPHAHTGVGVVRVAGVKIVRFCAPLFFANASVLRERLLAELSRRRALPPRLQWRALVLCFEPVSQIDTTSIEALGEVLHECRSQRVSLVIAAANASVTHSLERSGFVERLGGHGRLFGRVHEAVRAVLRGIVAEAPPAAAQTTEASPAEASPGPTVAVIPARLIAGAARALGLSSAAGAERLT